MNITYNTFYQGGISRLLAMSNGTAVMQRQQRFFKEAGIEQMEAAICLERMACICYQALQGVTRNGHTKQQYHFLIQEATHAQNQINGFLINLQESLRRVEDMMSEDYGIDPSCLSVEGVIETAMDANIQKLCMYKYLCAISDAESKGVFDKIISHVPREISFLKKERQFHQDKEENLMVGAFCRRWLVDSTSVSA